MRPLWTQWPTHCTSVLTALNVWVVTVFKQVFLPGYSVQPTVLSLCVTNKAQTIHMRNCWPGGERRRHAHRLTPTHAALGSEPLCSLGSEPLCSRSPAWCSDNLQEPFLIQQGRELILQLKLIPSSTQITPWLLSQRRQSSSNDQPQVPG